MTDLKVGRHERRGRHERKPFVLVPEELLSQLVGHLGDVDVALGLLQREAPGKSNVLESERLARLRAGRARRPRFAFLDRPLGPGRVG